MRGDSRVSVAGALLLALACGPQATGTQTNWLRGCITDADCASHLQCFCGACTRPCQADDSACADLPGAACVAASEPGAVALCSGKAPSTAGLCLPGCDDGVCAAGTACVAGVCAPLHEATAVVTVDASVRLQALVGFGAGTGWLTDEIAQHPAGAALYDAMFADSGYDALRLFNRYDDFGTTDLTSTVDLMSAAAERLGSPPTLLLTSTSPPAALKANGSELCSGNPDTCTLARLADGSFDYAGLAGHWRAVVEAYAAAGIEPDYISIQNDPDWVPPAATETDACRFLPIEGTTTVALNGADVQVEYPGYTEATAAVASALAELQSAPLIAAPDALGVESALSFAAELDLAGVDALAHHMLATDAGASDRDLLLGLGELGQRAGLPVFQTEGQADGLGTALFVHESLTAAGASLYLQNDFAASAFLDANPSALIALGAADFTLQDPYHALRHYAHDTDPGWVRIGASSELERVLATAWTSPDERRLTVVLVNPDATDVDVELALGDTQFATSRVTRTAFAGDERSADLGALPANRVVTVVGSGIVTVALSQ